MATKLLQGKSRVDFIEPEIKILEDSENIALKLYELWLGSRSDSVTDSISHDWKLVYKSFEDNFPDLVGETLEDTYKNFLKLMVKSNLPVLEFIHFSVRVNHASVGWREQLVRSRVSSYWMQTSRVTDLTKIDMVIPETARNNEKAIKHYQEFSEMWRKYQKLLQDDGVSPEEVRIAPMNMTHRVYWNVSLRALINVLKTRTSWIAQSNLWIPVIVGIVKELDRIDPLLTEVLREEVLGKSSGIEIKDGRVISYPYELDAEGRYEGKELEPVDPLYLNYKGLTFPKGKYSDYTIKKFFILKDRYIQLWSNEVLEALGWDRKHPDKYGPYDPQEGRDGVDFHIGSL